MSHYQSNSFGSNEYDEEFSAFYDSSQSTEATSVSFEYPDPNYAPTLYGFGGYATSQPAMHGNDALAGIASNPNVSIGNAYGAPMGYPTSATPAQNLQCPDEPFSQYNRLQPNQSGPYFGIQGTPASGPRQLNYQMMSNYRAYDSPSATTQTFNGYYPAISETYPNYQYQVPMQSQPQPISEQSNSQYKERLPGAQHQSRERRPRSDRSTTSSGHQCPECYKVLSRAADVYRHIETIHRRSEHYWRCLVCGHWEHGRREDKMKGHCYSEHGQRPRDYRYDKIFDIGNDYEHEPKPSVDGKDRRRKKKPLVVALSA